MKPKKLHKKNTQRQSEFEIKQSDKGITIQDFRDAGISIVEWARERNFNPRLVYVVLRNERKCLRGESFKIAKELGMK